jgi:hypothetical protein
MSSTQPDHVVETAFSDGMLRSSRAPSISIEELGRSGVHMGVHGSPLTEPLTCVECTHVAPRVNRLSRCWQHQITGLQLLYLCPASCGFPFNIVLMNCIAVTDSVSVMTSHMTSCHDKPHAFVQMHMKTTRCGQELLTINQP